MYSSLMALALAIICLDFVMLVNAGLYIVEPRQGTTCRGGQLCTVTWLDDGTRPLLSAIGVSTIGLYTGKQQLVQRIAPVDVSTAQSLTFTPNPAAGPNSDDYYISITSTTLKGNESIPYSGFSAWFSLTGMSGSFDTPLPAATSSIPIPASLTRTSSAVTSTSTIVGVHHPIILHYLATINVDITSGISDVGLECPFIIAIITIKHKYKRSYRSICRTISAVVGICLCVPYAFLMTFAPFMSTQK
ncbi:hypothetical protein NLJ89_g10476 [Agrocybe chaxingu]|uniref:Yeast cell wall synthesis Kre9/Knh1-like N-terminal domain-containing protein n=1 Tax=Agrocybe chaxingu TaxID=84603 RepID=A0A9W8JNT7_9AGAR|nr:hypothetical protein NLJ89_g10476 [Agrocybe chaxingu]